MIEQMEARVRGEVPGATQGFIPWQEADGQQLMLPPITKPSKHYKKGKDPASYHSSGSPSISDPVPRDGLARHPHSDLKLQSIGFQKQAALSKDLKEKTYLGLIKLVAKKQSPPLNPVQVVVLTQAASNSNLSEQQCRVLATVFDAIIPSWGPASLYAVLGMFRLLLLQPAFLNIYANRFSLEAKDTKESANKPSSSATSSSSSSATTTSSPTASSGAVDPTVQRIVELIRPNTSSDSPSESVPVRTRVKAFNALGNLLAYRSQSSQQTFSAARSLVSSFPTMLSAALASLSSKEQTLRLAAAKLVYNVALVLAKDDSDAGLEAVEALVSAIDSEEDPVTCLRLLLALGQLCFCNSGSTLVLSAVHSFLPQTVVTRFKDKEVPPKTAKTLLKITADLQMLMDLEEEQDDEDQISHSSSPAPVSESPDGVD
jgi:hypothetical protein